MSTTIKFAGKDPDGNAKAVRTDASGNIGVEVAAGTIQLPVDLQSHDISDADPIPVKMQSHGVTAALAVPVFPHVITKRVTLANNVEIRSTAATFIYGLIAQGGMTEDEIKQYRRIKLYLYDTHANAAANATAIITIYTAQPAQGDVSIIQSSGLIYFGNIKTNGEYACIFSPTVGAAGASANHVHVAALDCIHSNLMLKITFANAPESGSLTLIADLQG